MSLSKLAILGALMEKPMHGYELKQYFQACGGVFWMINYGSIYPTLKKLQEEVMVTGKKKPTATVDKIVYSITPKGAEEFKNILKKRMERQPTVRDEFTMHIFFLDYLDKNVSREFLLEKKQGNEVLLADLKRRESSLRKEMPKFRFGALERGIMHIETEISWLNNTLKEIEKEA